MSALIARRSAIAQHDTAASRRARHRHPYAWVVDELKPRHRKGRHTHRTEASSR